MAQYMLKHSSTPKPESPPAAEVKATAEVQLEKKLSPDSVEVLRFRCTDLWHVLLALFLYSVCI